MPSSQMQGEKNHGGASVLMSPAFGACIDLSTSTEDLKDWCRTPQQYGFSAESHSPATVTWRHADTHRAASGLVAVCIGEMHWSDGRLQELLLNGGPALTLTTAFKEHGKELLQWLHGSFAFVVLDSTRKIALAAIDRIGMQSLSFAVSSQRCVFGSSPDVVAKYPGIGTSIDPQAIHDLLFCHMVPAPRTIYLGVRKLLPAQYVSWESGKTETGFYWHMRYANHALESVESLEERFLGTLEECVGSAAAGDGRVGTFLSGGTDSSTVTGILAGLQGEPVDAYSIGFHAAGFDEMNYARIAAQRFAVRHHPYYLTPKDVADAIPLIAAAYDEPFGNASAVPTYFCALRAREDGIKCLLAGDGGDEIFGGNARYAKQRVFEWYAHLPERLRTRLLEPLLLGGGRATRLPLVRKAASYVAQARIPLPDRLESYNFLVRDSVSAVFEPDFLKRIDIHDPVELAREVYQRTDGESSIDRMMHLDLKLTLADNDLRKVRRMCELAGVIVRFPLLDERMVAFAGGLPTDLRVRGAHLRPFFKKALRDFLPRAIIDKKKHGFGLPFGVWMRDDRGLAEIAHESLAAFSRRGYVQPRYLESLLARHGRADSNYYGVLIWVVMLLEQWLRRRDL